MAQQPGAPITIAGSMRLVVVPLVVYLVCFYLLTFPQLHQFSTHYFTDEGDGLGNIWNLWWTNKAIMELHPVSYTHLRAHETGRNLVCRLLLEKKKKKK